MPPVSSSSIIGRQQATDRVQADAPARKKEAGAASETGSLRNRPVIVQISRSLANLATSFANALPPTIRNVFLRVEQSVARRLSGSARAATSANTANLRPPQLRGSIETARSNGYQAVKEAGNNLVPLLKKRVRREEGALLTDAVKQATKSNVRDVSSTGDNIEPEKAGTVLDHAVLSKLAYKGVNREGQAFALPAGYQLASPDDLPSGLQPFYNQRTGLLEMPQKGAKALLAKKGDTLVVAFAGTQPKGGREHSIQSDIQQRLGFSDPMYRDAAGITSMLLDHPANQKRAVQLTGHSLGGGLAMFSAIANTTADNHQGPANRSAIQSIGYNAAGLSTSYLAVLGTDRVSQAAQNLTTIRVKGDVVSSSGSAAGTQVKGHHAGKTVTLTAPDGGAVRATKAHRSESVINIIQGATGLKAQRC